MTLLLLGVVAFAWATKRLEKKEFQRLQSVTTQMLTGDAKRGAYVAITGGCIACHTDTDNGGALLAGGPPIATPFGTFYAPNITSDVTAGIGGWTIDDFTRALLLGRSPSNAHYYPAFPYTSYTAMSDQDIVDLKAWLDGVEPIPVPAPQHSVVWPFSNRALMIGWKVLFFDTDLQNEPSMRGSYLVRGPGHCAECHAARNMLGGVTRRSLSGNARGPDNHPVPGITHQDLSEWTFEDLTFFLEIGMTPDGDFTGGHMVQVIEYSTGKLNPARSPGDGRLFTIRGK